MKYKFRSIHINVTKYDITFAAKRGSTSPVATPLCPEFELERNFGSYLQLLDSTVRPTILMNLKLEILKSDWREEHMI